jgi:hypothetical protein
MRWTQFDWRALPSVAFLSRIQRKNTTTSPQVPQKDAFNLIAQRREKTGDPMSQSRRGPRVADPRDL